MLGKIETPIYILAALYVTIIGMVIVAIATIFLSYIGVTDFIVRQERALVVRHCRIYLENDKPGYYNGCVRQALAYYEENK